MEFYQDSRGIILSGIKIPLGSATDRHSVPLLDLNGVFYYLEYFRFYTIIVIIIRVARGMLYASIPLLSKS
jgi:hypothetical protein